MKLWQSGQLQNIFPLFLSLTFCIVVSHFFFATRKFFLAKQFRKKITIPFLGQGEKVTGGGSVNTGWIKHCWPKVTDYFTHKD